MTRQDEDFMEMETRRGGGGALPAAIAAVVAALSVPMAIAVLLAFLALATSGCGGPAGPPPLEPAFFIVQGEDLRGESHRGFPVQAGEWYGMAIANSSLPRAEASAWLGAGEPLVSYHNCCDLGLWGVAESLQGNLRTLMDDDDNFWLDEQGQRQSLFIGTWALRYTPEAAKNYAWSIAAVERDTPFIYLDNFFGEYPAWAARRLDRDLAGLRIQWRTYRHVLLTELRKLMPNTLFIGNVGGHPEWIPDNARPDGITIESGHVTPENRDALVEQFARFHSWLNVAWGWDAGGAARRGVIREEYDWDADPWGVRVEASVESAPQPEGGDR